MKIPHHKKRSIVTGMLMAFCISSLLSPVCASDHTNLEEGLPVRIEDAYPIGYLGREFQGLFRYDRTRDGKDLFILDPRLEYGFARNWQAKITAPFRLGSANLTGSGNVGLEVFHNFNQESLRVPAFAISARADFPSGRDSSGVDTTLKFIASKTRGRSTLLHRLHLNVAWKHNEGRRMGERTDAYMLAFGYSRRLSPDTIFVADYVRDQELYEDKTSNVIEVGIRRQLTPLTTLAVGVGAGIGPDSPPFRFTLGFQHAF